MRNLTGKGNLETKLKMTFNYCADITLYGFIDWGLVRKQNICLETRCITLKCFLGIYICTYCISWELKRRERNFTAEKVILNSCRMNELKGKRTERITLNPKISFVEHHSYSCKWICIAILTHLFRDGYSLNSERSSHAECLYYVYITYIAFNLVHMAHLM